MRTFLLSLIMAYVLFSCNNSIENKSVMNNPILDELNTPFNAPPFDKIKTEHFVSAFKKAMKQQNKAIENIINNTAEPDFNNTIEAYENSSELLDYVSSVFFNLKSAHTNDKIQAISKKLAPILSDHNDEIKLNQQLFAKINTVYNAKDKLKLSTEQIVLLKKVYRDFVRGGANLNNEVKERFKDINKAISLLHLKFGDNVLAENNRFTLTIDNKNDLSGLSEASINNAAEEASLLGYKDKWVFTIHKPSLMPFLENADNRKLREKMYKAYLMKGDYNDSLDNKKIINELVNLRIERAQLLGYETHADYILDKNMAKTPDRVYDLLNKIMPAALKLARSEVAEMEKILKNEGNNFELKPWDYQYYAAKVKQKQYAIDENMVRQYLKLEAVRDGMFWVANQLYGITFTKTDNVPVYHPEVEVFEVKESNDEHIGLLYLDYHTRDSKRAGAWCTSYRTQKYKDNKRISTIISIVCNFSKPAGNAPVLLTTDQVKTLFHEFGHALDGLLSNKNYASLRTPRDFVELPSQIMENWAFEPAVLKHYAKHNKTGEKIPTRLIEKITKASKFNQGFNTTEVLAAAYLDMDYHTLNKVANLDINEFEKASMKKINLIPEIDPRYRSGYFLHIFASSSYSSGYYSYVWAEMLDADAFDAFKEKGIFDKATAMSFRTNILELGGTQDPMELYRKFRGNNPGIEPLLKRKGLN